MSLVNWIWRWTRNFNYLTMPTTRLANFLSWPLLYIHQNTIQTIWYAWHEFEQMCPQRSWRSQFVLQSCLVSPSWHLSHDEAVKILLVRYHEKWKCFQLIGTFTWGFLQMWPHSISLPHSVWQFGESFWVFPHVVEHLWPHKNWYSTITRIS